MAEPDATTCYRHADREAGVRCQRCERFICPECMVSASVGFHCPECVKQHSTRVYTARSLVTRPVVVPAIIAINALVYLATASSARLFFDLGLSGGFIDVDGEWWRIITSGFVHSRDNILHILFNMYLLWVLGRNLEQAVGYPRFAGLYLTSILGGSFGVLLLSPGSFTIGASGGVFGLMGATAIAFRSRGIDVWASGVGGLIAINLLLTFAVPSISVGGHLGGLVAGAIGGYFLFEVDADAKRGKAGPAALAMLAVVLVIGSIWAATTWMDPIFGSNI